MGKESKYLIIMLLQLVATQELVKWYYLLLGRKPGEAHKQVWERAGLLGWYTTCYVRLQHLNNTYLTFPRWIEVIAVQH